VLELDLTDLATGINSLSRARKYTFSGRPSLTADLLDPIEAYAATISSHSLKHIKHAIRLLWRFLDAHPHLDVTDIASLSDVHGTALTLWLPTANSGEQTYRQLKTLVQFARRYRNLPEVFWPTLHDRDDNARSRDLEPPSVKAVYKALIQEAQQIKAMFLDGEALASQGRDPRGSRGFPGTARRKAAWEFRENHAWLMKSLAVPTIVDKAAIRRDGGQGLNQANRREQAHSGPAYLAPGHSIRASRGFVGKLRWFYPSLGDTIIFFLLFMLTTGWNESTALHLDVSQPDWVATHWLQPKLKVLKALKPRSGSYQYAIALEHSQWRPYQIVCYMNRITSGLRRRLLISIDQIRAEIDRADSPELRKQLASLSARSRSPWLFHSLDNVGEVLALDAGFNAAVNSALTALILRHNIRDSTGKLCKFTTSDWRDAFAANTNAVSGPQASRASLGHASDRAIDRYLNQPRLRHDARAQVRHLFRTAFSEIRAGFLIDGSTLRLLVERGAITAEERARIAEFKNRSRVGMGCINPTEPPKTIAPDHKDGALCLIQRCTMCSNGVVFDDSLDGLARRYAELIAIQEMIPASTWAESDYPDEKEATELVLKSFPREMVDEYTRRHRQRFQDGSDTVLDLEPSHER